jgi:GntR family transcriptional repressor for pyruvate dehydrogenase complex
MPHVNQQDPTAPGRATTPSEVAKAIQELIIDADLQTGDKLPSQAELAERLKVGTRSVREAIKILEARGMVDTHQGKGVFIKNNSLDFFLEVLNDSLVFDVYKDNKLLLQLTHVRQLIESNVIHELAAYPRPEMLKSLIEILDNMEQCLPDQDIERYNMLDVKFHVTLVNACGNEILATLYRNLTSLFIKSVAQTGHLQGSLEKSLADHRRILEALIARDPARARELMEGHLSNTEKTLSEMME